jgi:hypothetical protein
MFNLLLFQETEEGTRQVDSQQIWMEKKISKSDHSGAPPMLSLMDVMIAIN